MNGEPRMKTQQKWVLAAIVLMVLALGIAMVMRGQRSRLFGERDTSSAAQVTGRSPAGVSSEGGRSLSRLGDYGRVPAFDLVTQDGEPLRHTDLLGTLWVGDFIFTNCASTCPMMTRAMQDVADALDPEFGVQFVSFSVDPERDTPEVLARYAQDYGIDTGNWTFLTGDKQTLRDLVLNGFHLSVQDATREELLAGADEVIHSTRFVVVDPRGVIRGYYDGTDDEALKQLVTDLGTLHAESAERMP
jgi:cytochrome oxidase Cu insertion factor (SCO1/SenC/PrrC family)